MTMKTQSQFTLINPVLLGMLVMTARRIHWGFVASPGGAADLITDATAWRVSRFNMCRFFSLAGL